MKKYVLILLILALLVAGCDDEADPDGVCQVWITSDFGQTMIWAEQVPCRAGEAVLDIMRRHVAMETTYGGGFVEFLAGLAAQAGPQQMDWFYSVNGVMAGLGGNAYHAQGGDLIWWDYHRWGGSTISPAVIGAFPRPFTQGYGAERGNAVTLVYGEGLQDEAQMLAAFLGRENVSVAQSPFAQVDLAKRDHPLIAVLRTEEIASDPFLNGLFAEGGRRGLFLQWDGDHLAACDCLGEPSQELPDGWGWIVATGQGLGDPNPLWLIGANDQEGIAQAVQALLTGGCERCYGALVDKAGVCYPLPWSE